MKILRSFSIAALLTAVVVLGTSFGGANATPVKKVVLNASHLEDINGKSGYQYLQPNKKTYVQFWATWCSVCLSHLNEYAQLSQNQDINYITVLTPDALGEDRQEDLMEWVKHHVPEGMTVLFDNSDHLVYQIGVRGYPAGVLFDEDGNFIEYFRGYLPSEDVIDLLVGVDVNHQKATQLGVVKHKPVLKHECTRFNKSFF